MKIEKSVVEYIGHLARLELEANEVEQYTTQLNGILQYMETLGLLDTEGVEPTGHAIPLSCLMREDREKDSFSVDESLRNAPLRQGSAFRVPPVIEVD